MNLGCCIAYQRCGRIGSGCSSSPGDHPRIEESRGQGRQTADAIHLASASIHQCDHMFTYEEQIDASAMGEHRTYEDRVALPSRTTARHRGMMTASPTGGSP